MTGVAAEICWTIAKKLSILTARFWVNFGTVKLISATTGYIFMKLGDNIAEISQIDKFVLFFSKFDLFSELGDVKVAIFTLNAKIRHFSIVSFVGIHGPKYTKFFTLVKHIMVCIP